MIAVLGRRKSGPKLTLTCTRLLITCGAAVTFSCVGPSGRIAAGGLSVSAKGAFTNTRPSSERSWLRQESRRL